MKFKKSFILGLNCSTLWYRTLTYRLVFICYHPEKEKLLYTEARHSPVPSERSW